MCYNMSYSCVRAQEHAPFPGVASSTARMWLLGFDFTCCCYSKLSRNQLTLKVCSRFSQWPTYSKQRNTLHVFSLRLKMVQRFAKVNVHKQVQCVATSAHCMTSQQHLLRQHDYCTGRLLQAVLVSVMHVYLVGCCVTCRANDIAAT